MSFPQYTMYSAFLSPSPLQSPHSGLDYLKCDLENMYNTISSMGTCLNEMYFVINEQQEMIKTLLKNNQELAVMLTDSNSFVRERASEVLRSRE